MVEIPAELRAVFTARLAEADGPYRIEIPASEVQQDALSPEETYRIAILDPVNQTTESTTQPVCHDSRDRPPVKEGELREVTITAVGDQGDGIAKIEHGFVVIVPGAAPGEQPTVKIEHVRRNVAFAAVEELESRA
jgi:predicted RNA-binding protein with TRAM domain